MQSNQVMTTWKKSENYDKFGRNRMKTSISCFESIKRTFSKPWKRNVFIFFTVFAIIHILVLIIGFLYVKTSLVQSYRTSFRELLHLNPTSEGHIKKQESREFYHSFEGSPRKTILMWNMPRAVSYPKELNPYRCGRCDIIGDKKRVSESDAVVLHYHNATNVSYLPDPSTRNEDQVYVWLCRESPNTTKEIYHLDLSRMNNVINWTMTHRLDSDVIFPYSEILHRMHDAKVLESRENAKGTEKSSFVEMHYTDVQELIEHKRHLVAWVVGNCDKTKGAKVRMELSNQLLKAGLEIDRFGRCSKGREFPPYRSEEAHERLSEYKFYLAFENTYKCRDYVTYKFWKNAIYSGAVPIVWGASKSDLLRLSPKHSFIHVEDFASLNELVKYIKYLDTNTTAYKEYFKWRENELSATVDDLQDPSLKSDWIFSLSEAFGYCKLCRMLHAKDSDPTFRRKTVKSLSQWWYDSESNYCVSR